MLHSSRCVVHHSLVNLFDEAQMFEFRKIHQFNRNGSHIFSMLQFTCAARNNNIVYDVRMCVVTKSGWGGEIKGLTENGHGPETVRHSVIQTTSPIYSKATTTNGRSNGNRIDIFSGYIG